MTTLKALLKRTVWLSREINIIRGGLMVGHGNCDIDTKERAAGPFTMRVVMEGVVGNRHWVIIY
jgi:hypothetical protein